MFSASPAMTKAILAFLFFLPATGLYLKILFPSLAANGFQDWVLIPLELVFIAFVCIFFRHPKLGKTGLGILVCLILFHLFGLLSAYFSSHFHASLMKQTEYLVHMLFAYSVWVSLLNTQRHEKLIWVLLITFVWVHYYILAAWHSNPDAYYYNWVSGTPMFNNIRHLGFIQIVIFPFLFAPMLWKIKHGNIISFILLCIFWTGVIWSSSRGTFLASIVAYLFLLYCYKNNIKALLYIGLISFFTGWWLAFQFPSESASLDPWRLLFMAEADAGRVDINSASSGRTGIWFDTIKAAFIHNSLLGLGADGYRYIIPHIFQNTAHPHSGSVQLLAEHGIIGSALIIGVIVFLFQFRKNESEVNKYQSLAVVSLAGTLLGSGVDGHFYYANTVLLVAISLALYVPARELTPQSDSPQHISKSQPILICLLSIFLLYPVSKHWGTYIEQQFPLLDKKQLETVESFPSHYLPIKWMSSSIYDPNLKQEATYLGQRVGPRHCNFFLLDYEVSGPKDSIIQSITKTCRKDEIIKYGDEKLLGKTKELTK